jgi:RimJ/RimL family protein N-acetyltransferase
MEIYEGAREYMKINGNPNQWTNGYPDIKMITNDIKKGKSYVCLENEDILGVFYFGIEADATYMKIYEGKWQNDKEYGVIHRIAVAGHQKGIATYCINWCFNECKNLRIDTHKDNISMKRVLEKNGFTYCGIIHLEYGDERIAYQKS